MIVLLGVPILLFGLLGFFVWFPGIMGMFPGLWFLGTLAVAFVGWRNRGDIHAKEHLRDMLPWMITAIAIAALISLTR